MRKRTLMAARPCVYSSIVVECSTFTEIRHEMVVCLGPTETFETVFVWQTKKKSSNRIQHSCSQLTSDPAVGPFRTCPSETTLYFVPYTLR